MELKIGRNEPCPCGSGQKFKNCHMGREAELMFRRDEKLPPQASSLICALPEVDYGRSGYMAGALDIEDLTGTAFRIRFVDLAAYQRLGFSGLGRAVPGASDSAGLFINPIKTRSVEPDRLYVALTKGCTDSTLIHQLAHVLHYAADDPPGPDVTGRIKLETGVPVEQLEHTAEYARWLLFLALEFDVELDAEDSIIGYLAENGLLLSDAAIADDNRSAILVGAERLMRFLKERAGEIDELIRSKPGYIGQGRKGG